jgi:hypothetical protein
MIEEFPPPGSEVIQVYKPMAMSNRSRYGHPILTSTRGFKVYSWLDKENLRTWLEDNEPLQTLLDELTDRDSGYFVVKHIEIPEEDLVIIHQENECVLLYKLEEEHVEPAGPDTVRGTDEAPGAGSVEGCSPDAAAP